MPEPMAFFNGEWIPAVSAAVPVSDIGFILGTTVTEQLRTFAGKIFHLDDHLQRLAGSLEILGLDPGMSRNELADTARELVSRNYPLSSPGGDLGVSIFVTPGPHPTYAASGSVRPRVCLHTYVLPFHLWAEKYRRGQALATTEIEQVPPTCWPAELKCRSRMHYYLADRRAAELFPGARAVLLDADGYVTEASTANVLIYNADEGLVSPPASKILHGISLSAAASLGAQLGMKFIERELTPDDLAAADEVFLTSTSCCMLPATFFNGRTIGTGRPGPVFHRLMAAWSELVGVDIIAQAMS